MKIAILGNGRTRDLFVPENYDLVIGCNLPPEGVKVDYCVVVDAKAIMLAYREGAPFYHRLKDFKLVIGPRCAHGIKQCKSKPGGDKTVYQHLKENDNIFKEIGLWPDAKDIGQRFFSAGHLAFAYANNEWPQSELHLFGFDSFFTGNQASYSDKIRNQDVTQIKRNREKYNRSNPVNTVGEWYGVWERVLTSSRNTATGIYIHGFEGDDINDFFKKHLKVIRHDKQVLQEQ